MTVYGSKFMFRATRNPVERIPAVCMKEKNKGGRPPKPAGEKLKERLTVKMAAADYYALRGKARAAGLTWAEYARTAAAECTALIEKIDTLIDQINE